MEQKLKNKVAIVTGSSKGIGAGIAKGLANGGAKVVVNYSSSKQEAEQLVNLIRSNGGEAIAVQGNVSKEGDVKKLFAEAHKKFSRLDILVNNAGVFKPTPIESISEENFHYHFNTNVLGGLLCCREAVKYFDDRGGNIINLTSVISKSPVVTMTMYAATKAAIDNYTISLAKELAPRNIRVNAVAPGLVETEGTHDMGMFDGGNEKQYLTTTPLGRIGQPEDIAKVVMFLASDDAEWITAERITASGGMQ